MIEKLARPKQLTHIVFEAILDSICEGKIAPGEWLRQESLSKQLGVSQTPVRQALERLVVEGMAERIPHKGVRVIELSHEEITTAYYLRMLIEGPIVRLAAQNLSTSCLAELSQSVDRASKLVTRRQISERRKLNKEFHLSICNGCGSSLLARSYEIVENFFPDWMLYEGMYRQPSKLERRLNREIEDHRALIEALMARDGKLAEQRAIMHIQGLSDELAELVGVSVNSLLERQESLWPMPWQQIYKLAFDNLE